MDLSNIDDYLNFSSNKKEKEKKDDVSDNENESDSESEIEDDDIDYNSSDNSKGNSNKKRQVQISFGEWKLRKAGRRESLKLEIADMCEKIVSDPYIHCRLFELLYSLVEDQDIEIMQCSMLSLTRTIIDVMPPYRIGTINNNVKLKQENEKVRNFENQLLTTYQKFLKFLFKSSQLFHSNVNISRLNKQNNGRQRLIMGKCAVKCNCMFLKHASHFNYTKEVIKRTIPLLNSPDKSIRIESCNAMKNILSNEPINNVTVEAVKSICGKIESRNFECSQECIDVFLALPLKLLHPPDTKMDDDDENNKPTKSKQEKKLEALVSKDLKELDGLDKKKEYERQKVIIESIFGIYFFILKLDVKTKRSNGSNSNGKGQQKKSIYKQGHLLACALKGMAKFAQLVNVELVVTLVCVVSEKLKDEANNLSLETKLHCILTAFGCISGRGTAIEMDLKEHFVTLYSILSEMIYYYNWQHFELIFECFNKMFYNKRRKVIVDRIAAFIKRLMTLSLHIPPQYSIACMHQIRKLIKLDARLECMLEQGGGYDQIFDGKNDNPDQSHALASCLWECTANCNNFHLFCRKYARDLTGLKDIPLQLEMEKPWNLIKEYDHSRRGNFNPIIKYSQRQEKKSKNNKGKKELTDWNNETKINQMIDEWFEFDTNEIKDRERKNYQFDDNTATNCLNYYFNCNKLCQRNDTLFELNDKFVTLNQLLMED